MPFKPTSSPLPLTPLAFEILLALTEGNRHGYAILQQVELRLTGLLPLRTGTLYRALARLTEDGLIREVDSRTADDDERRRYYHLTPYGRKTLAAEARRLAHQVAAARAQHLLGEEE